MLLMEIQSKRSRGRLMGRFIDQVSEDKKAVAVENLSDRVSSKEAICCGKP